jgi:hypothetical protein
MLLSLVARADRADFLSDLAEYLFTDSGSTGSRQMTGVYTVGPSPSFFTR